MKQLPEIDFRNLNFNRITPRQRERLMPHLKLAEDLILPILTGVSRTLDVTSNSIRECLKPDGKSVLDKIISERTGRNKYKGSVRQGGKRR